MTKKKTMKAQTLEFLAAHNAFACVLVGAGTAIALVGVFAFIAFSGFGASADFIYNQF